jgi:hypothetical protein
MFEIDIEKCWIFPKKLNVEYFIDIFLENVESNFQNLN